MAYRGYATPGAARPYYGKGPPQPYYGKGPPRPYYGKGPPRPYYGRRAARPYYGKPYWVPTAGGGLVKQYPPGTAGIPYAFYPGYGLVQ